MPASFASMTKVALVVDDSMLMRYTVCRFLEERGFTVESATNGAEALEALTRVQPGLIVTDMQMPKMSGSELITALKGNLETAKIPIIIVRKPCQRFRRIGKARELRYFQRHRHRSAAGEGAGRCLGQCEPGSSRRTVTGSHVAPLS